MTEPDAVDVQADIADAIQTVIRNREGGFVTRWCAIVESVDEHGERGVWTVAADDMKPWDVFGLLDYAVERERAAMRDRDED